MAATGKKGKTSTTAKSKKVDKRVTGAKPQPKKKKASMADILKNLKKAKKQMKQERAEEFRDSIAEEKEAERETLEDWNKDLRHEMGDFTPEENAESNKGFLKNLLEIEKDRRPIGARTELKGEGPIIERIEKRNIERRDIYDRVINSGVVDLGKETLSKAEIEKLRKELKKKGYWS